MADYTVFVEAGSALVRMLRERLVPEPVSSPEAISLCTPYESENNQLTVYLYHMEEDVKGGESGYYQATRDTQEKYPSRFQLSFLITAHSKAPVQLRQADCYRIIGAAVAAIKDSPRLDERYFEGTLKQAEMPLFLTLERPNFDQMMKIWNNTSVPYKLSVVCKLSGISLDSGARRRVPRVTDVIIDTKLRGER